MTIEELLQRAETATTHPPLPPGGIPLQRVPAWIRWPLRLFILPFIHLELMAEKIAKWIIRPPFEQKGACKRRGNCCHYILLPEVKDGFFKWGTLLLFWQTEIYGFYLRQRVESEGKPILVMGCRYLQTDGSCSRYLFRPKVCRSWPLIEIFGRPRLLKGCGYAIKLRDSYARKHPELVVLQNFEKERKANDKNPQ